MTLVAVLVLAPAGLGAAPSHTTTLKAPFKTLVTASFSSTGQVGCGFDKIVTAPHFVAHSGLGGFSLAGTAPACAKLPNGIANRGQTTAQVSIVVPILVKHPAITIESNWSISASGSVSLTSTPCPTSTAATYACYEFAQAYLFSQSYLIDTTNGSLFFGTNFWPGFQNVTENDTFCSGGTCSTAILGSPSGGFSATQGMDLFVNATGLNSTHTYELEVDLYGGALAELDASNTKLVGGHAAATVNFATLGNGAKLNWVKYT
ncbi:MAG: hypothetical protein L3K19_02845 [Thermoplasmata archaeon]|nr:hypothetical protein [Thermoplasmata archaeon]